MRRRSFLTRAAAGAAAAVPLARLAGAAPTQTMEPTSGGDAVARIGAFVETVRYHWRVPGIAVAVMAAGKPLMAAGFGRRSLADDSPADAHTAFNIGSCAKAFTAAAAALLVDAGRIGWDDPIKPVMPELVLDDPAVTAEVSLRDFLACRVGLSRASIAEYGSDLSRAQVIARARDVPRAAPFRSRFCYSDVGFILAAAAIGHLAGMPFEDFLARHLLAPLGMADSSAAPRPWLTLRNLAAPHDFLDYRPRALPPRDGDNLMGAGTLALSAADALAWLGLQLGQSRLISARSLAAMQSVQIATPQRYGLGWHIGESHGRRLVAHGGETRGFTALVRILPEIGFASFVAANSESHAPAAISSFIDRSLNGLPPRDELDDYDTAIAERVAAAAQRYELDLKADPLTPAALPLEAFAGTYRNRGFGTLTLALHPEAGALRFAIADLSLYDGWLLRYGAVSFAHQEDAVPGQIRPPRPRRTLDPRVHFRAEAGRVSGLDWLDKWFGPVSFARA
ncbi:MAG TPA: serine hydrolase [Alphaproteobacteria bacterium]|nr:serine hydrolase [Alphaproteobacteria bacterium]